MKPRMRRSDPTGTTGGATPRLRRAAEHAPPRPRRPLGIAALMASLVWSMVTAAAPGARAAAAPPARVGARPARGASGSAAGVWTARAEAALLAMQRAFFVDQTDSYISQATVGQIRHRSLFEELAAPQAAVWDVSWALAAIEDVAALPGARGRWLPTLRLVTQSLQAYWDAGAEPPAYAPTQNPSPSAVKYFDDNAWVGLDLVTAWRLTGDRRDLYRAEAVMRYEESGWDSQGGGIWWNDQRNYRNTAANAPTAELAARLYLATGDHSYLAWAERIDHWEMGTLVAADGWVADGIGALNLPVGIHDAQYTYNYGAVVGAAVELYRATGQVAYLHQAERVAAYALAHLRQADGAWLPQARFNGVLSDDLLLLLRTGHAPWVRAPLLQNARLLWARDRAADGLVGSNWNGPPPTGTVQLLTETGAVRTLAAAAAALAEPTARSPERHAGRPSPRTGSAAR
jgi:hypothetical protein